MRQPERIDLHTHTDQSDGLLSPLQLLERAEANGVSALAITDHDTAGAYTSSVVDEAHRRGIRLIPGIELSVSDGDTRAHILGLGINVSSASLQEALREQQEGRAQYTQAVCERLEELGWRVDAPSLLESEATVTKAHIARAVLGEVSNELKLLDRFGGIPNAGRFIETFMIHGTEGYVPTAQQLTTAQAVKLIHQAGGAAIFAHPVAQLYESGQTLESLEAMIVESDVDGIEAYYVYYAKRSDDVRIDAIDEMVALAERQKLLVTGGSDFHGTDPSIGNFVDVGFQNDNRFVPADVLTALDKVIKTKQL